MGYLNIKKVGQIDTEDVVIDTQRKTINGTKIEDVYEFNRLVFEIAKMNENSGHSGAKRTSGEQPAANVRLKIDKEEEEPEMKVDIHTVDEELGGKIADIFVKEITDPNLLDAYLKDSEDKRPMTSAKNLRFAKWMASKKGCAAMWNRATDKYNDPVYQEASAKRRAAAQKGLETKRLKAKIALERRKIDIFDVDNYKSDKEIEEVAKMFIKSLDDKKALLEKCPFSTKITFIPFVRWILTDKAAEYLGLWKQSIEKHLDFFDKTSADGFEIKSPSDVDNVVVDEKVADLFISSMDPGESIDEKLAPVPLVKSILKTHFTKYISLWNFCCLYINY